MCFFSKLIKKQNITTSNTDEPLLMFHKMSSRSQLTKDLNESVKALLGKQIKIILKNVVKQETRGDKTENRVIVFSPCRLFILTAKVPTRIDHHFHYLDINAIESLKPNKLSLTVGEKTYNFLTNCDTEDSHEVDSMVLALATAVKNIFPTVPLLYIIKKLNVEPIERISHILKWEVKSADAHGLGPCGGFSTQYACMCDFYNVPYREEVAWDVDTIYLSQDTKELCLKDFEHLDSKDLIAIISALEYNTWFRKVRSNQKMTHETLERLLQVMRKSRSIEELHLENLGLRADFSQKLSQAVLANPYSPLHTLDLSHNLIEDKGVAHIGTVCSKLPKGIVHLNLSHCGLTSKGINTLASSLSQNLANVSSLSYLNVSGNNLKEDVNSLLSKILARPNVLTFLDISGTDCMLEALFGALLHGCATNLTSLNVSRNVFTTKKNKEIPPSFKQFFTSTLSLKYLNISYCKLPLEALKNLLLGLACNESTAEITLDISNNNLGGQGAHTLESCIHGVRCISSLDISENNMDFELSSVIQAISKNKSIKHLFMGRSFPPNMKAKHVSAVMEAVVSLVQDEDCVLQSLMLPDSRLKADVYNLINALGSNACLQTLDISGNAIGDGGARLLAKALQLNTRIRTIYYDKNNISLQGYCDLAYALESNYSVRCMPFPIYDVLPCMKTNAEKIDTVMKKIQMLLQRNVTPKKYSNGQAFRLQQGFLLSSTQQTVDKLIAQTRDCIRSLGGSGDSLERNNEIDAASALIRDADNSKQLLSHLNDVMLRCESTAANLDLKLRSLSRDLHAAIVSYIEGTLDSMLKCAEDDCPLVLSNCRVTEDIRKACLEKSFVSFDFVETCVMDQAGTEIINRISEIILTMAAHVSDRITDEVIEQLSKNYKLMVADSSRKRSSTPDVLRSGTRVSSGDDQSECCSLTDQSPMATPHMSNKKKSLHGRKLRPKSVVDGAEVVSADHIPDLLPTLPQTAEESLDSIAELPTQQLQHLVKGRPRRMKTRQPTRPMLRGSDVVEQMEDLDTGLDVFFRPDSVTPSAVTPLISPTSDDSEATFPCHTSPAQKMSSPLLPPRSRSTDNLEKHSALLKSPINRSAIPQQSSLDKEEDTSSGSTITEGNSLPMSPTIEPRTPIKPSKIPSEAGGSGGNKLRRGVPAVAHKPLPKLANDLTTGLMTLKLTDVFKSEDLTGNQIDLEVSEINRGDFHRRTTGSLERRSVRELAANLNTKCGGSAEWLLKRKTINTHD